MVIKSLIEQLNFKNIAIRIMPTIRENDGLAMSSRNLRLSKNKEKKQYIFIKHYYISKIIIEKLQ
jgi:pantoate--beta-alanine ligase